MIRLQKLEVTLSSKMDIGEFDDFKMERFKKVPSKIADQVRLDRTPSPLRKALLQE